MGERSSRLRGPPGRADRRGAAHHRDQGHRGAHDAEPGRAGRAQQRRDLPPLRRRSRPARGGRGARRGGPRRRPTPRHAAAARAARALHRGPQHRGAATRLGILRLVLSEQFLLALPARGSERLVGVRATSRGRSSLECLRDGQAAGDVRADLAARRARADRDGHDADARAVHARCEGSARARHSASATALLRPSPPAGRPSPRRARSRSHERPAVRAPSEPAASRSRASLWLVLPRGPWRSSSAWAARLVAGAVRGRARRSRHHRRRRRSAAARSRASARPRSGFDLVGRLSEVLVDEGARVTLGQELARLETESGRKPICAPRRPASPPRAPRCSGSPPRRRGRGRCSSTAEREAARTQRAGRSPARVAGQQHDDAERSPARRARRARSRARPALGGDARHRRRRGRRRAATGRHGARDAARALRRARDPTAARARRHRHRRLDRAAHRRHQPRVRERRRRRDGAAAARRGPARARSPSRASDAGRGQGARGSPGRPIARPTSSSSRSRPTGSSAGSRSGSAPTCASRSGAASGSLRVPIEMVHHDEAGAFVYVDRDGRIALVRPRLGLDGRRPRRDARAASRRATRSSRAPRPAAIAARRAALGGPMNLALRDVRRHLGRFVGTAAGLGLLLTVVIAMQGIYAGHGRRRDDPDPRDARRSVGRAARHARSVRRGLAARSERRGARRRGAGRAHARARTRTS